MDSPLAQDSADQSPGQLSNSSLLQPSGENMAENNPGSPWLAREWKRFSQNDLYDVLPSSVQGRSLQEDAIRQAKTELKEQDSAIKKHLVKKAALEEKLRFWQLDSTVSNSSVDSDGCAGNPFQSGLAIQKRIRELKESSKQQDVAIQKHIIRKASLEREKKASQPNLDYESEQPGKRLVFEAGVEDADGEETRVSMLVGNRPKEDPAQNDVESDGKRLMPAYTCSEGPDEFGTVYSRDSAYSRDYAYSGDITGNPLRLIRMQFASRRTSYAQEAPLREVGPVAPLTLDSSIPAKAPSHHGWDTAKIMRYCDAPPVNTQSREYHEIESPGAQATSGDTVQHSRQQTPFRETIEQQDKQPRLGGEKQGTVTTGPGKSFTYWLLRRRPSSFGSVMDGMFRKFERVAIGGWPARKSRDKRAVPVEGSVNK